MVVSLFERGLDRASSLQCVAELPKRSTVSFGYSPCLRVQQLEYLHSRFATILQGKVQPYLGVLYTSFFCFVVV